MTTRTTCFLSKNYCNLILLQMVVFCLSIFSQTTLFAQCGSVTIESYPADGYECTGWVYVDSLTR